MFATLLTLALFAAPALNGVAAFNINSPDLTQCGSAHISWDATKGPYNLIVVDSNDPCGAVLADLGDHNSTSITWKVDFASNKTLMFSLEDANGDEAWSSAMTVAASADASCLNNAAAAVSGSSSAVAGVSSQYTNEATETVGAAGAAVTGGSDDGTPNPLGGASTGSNGASALHMNPIMAVCALFAAAALVL